MASGLGTDSRKERKKYSLLGKGARHRKTDNPLRIQTSNGKKNKCHRRSGWRGFGMLTRKVPRGEKKRVRGGDSAVVSRKKGKEKD